MGKIKKITTCDIPDGYYAQHWSKEGVILRDKVNEIVDEINEKGDSVAIVVNASHSKDEYDRLVRAYDQLLEDFHEVLERNGKALDFLNAFQCNGNMDFPFNRIKDILMGGK